MRPTRHVTAMLLVAALATVGCSKREETSRTKAESTHTAQARPVSTSGESTAVRPTDAGSTNGDATTKVAELATFGDGKAAYAAKQYSDATAIFERYTVRRPENAWGHYMLGLSAWKGGDLAKAESAFEKAVSIDPRHVKSYVNVSRVFIDQKRYDEAVERLTRAADIDASSTEVQRLLGRVYHAQGKTDEAVEAYRRAMELNELDAWSMNNLGLVFLETQRAEEALPLFEKAVELRKNVPAFHNNLGMALEHTGRFRDAAAAYASALAADPGYDKAKQNLARVEAIKANREEKTTSK
jgi:tetratricopeptide (TPR) repeat protein